MVEHVYRRAAMAAVDAVIVATDDQRIVDAVEGFGGLAWLTRSDHPTGTDRLAEIAATLPCDAIIFDLEDAANAFRMHLSGTHPKVIIRCNDVPDPVASS